MRIALLANATSVHTKRWAESLAARGHIVHVFGIRDSDLDGVEVSRVGFGRADSANPVVVFGSYCRLLLTLRRRLKDFEPDVLHAHYATTHGVIAALRSPAPVVLTAWGSDVMKGDRPVRWPLRRLAAFAARRAAAVTCASEAMAEIVESISGVTPEIVRFGVDSGRFDTSFGRERDRPTIGFLKNLDSKYGPDVLIEAMPLIVERHSDIRLLMAGNGPMREELEHAVAAAGLAAHVTFVGWTEPEEVPAFLSQLDLLVNPSRSESFGVVLLEAAAAGVPVVASDVGGVREAVIEGETGVLTPPGDARSLANAVADLLDDSERLSDMGRRAAAVARTRYRWSESVAQMETVLAGAARRTTT